MEIEFGDRGNEKSFGYADAIADMFGKEIDEVRDDMKAELKARGW